MYVSFLFLNGGGGGEKKEKEGRKENRETEEEINIIVAQEERFRERTGFICLKRWEPSHQQQHYSYCHTPDMHCIEFMVAVSGNVLGMAADFNFIAPSLWIN